MTDFSSISDRYKDTSLVQAPAGIQLIELLSIPADADILDVGCGTGNLTMELRERTSGRVVGIDRSYGMIGEACKLYQDHGIEFHQIEDSGMSFEDEFDIVYCNSAFQWFRDPLTTLRSFCRALRPSGRAGIQAPARKRYSPNFVNAVEYGCEDKSIGELFQSFSSPWFFLDSGEAYRELFEQAGFQVLSCEIVKVKQSMTPGKVFDVFNSGAAAGYLNQQYFSRELPADFSELMLKRIRDSFENQADSDGLVDLEFNRIYAVGQKTS